MSYRNAIFFHSRDFGELEIRGGNTISRVATGLAGGAPTMSGGQLLKDATDSINETSKTTKDLKDKMDKKTKDDGKKEKEKKK